MRVRPREPSLRSVFRSSRRLAACVVLGILSGCDAEPPPAQLADPEESERELALLEALGYVGAIEPAPDAVGVTRHDEAKAHAGLNLYTSGHAPEAILVDMAGRELHRWSHGYREAWPNLPFELPPEYDSWRRVHLFENGDLLAIVEGVGLLKLDKDSKLLWARRNRAHHDLEVLPDGSIQVLTRRARVEPGVNRGKPFLEDFISFLDDEGRERRRVSVLESFRNAGIELSWPVERKLAKDPLHTNTLEVLDGRAAHLDPAFRQGNVLISLRDEHLLAVVDPEQRRVVWTKRGAFRRQHDPRLLDNGNMLLFDNEGLPRQSTVFEFHPVTGEVAWRYRGTAEAPFYSMLCGTAQRLPNGNTLITESSRGRAFEVPPDARIVWEFYNPHRAGKDDALIAELFELIRLPADFPVDWADHPPGE